MNRGPQTGRSVTDYVAKANAAWGDPPAWIIALAEACTRTSQSVVAKQLNYSAATVSQLLSNAYRGDLSRLEDMVRGALLSETIDCPALGELPRNVCLEWQAKPYAPTSSYRAQMYRACRDNCPHSRVAGSLKGEDA